jgi:hypothetical protein
VECHGIFASDGAQPAILDVLCAVTDHEAARS